MRCIREGTRAQCNRCSDARANCVFSIARKAGRPSASGKRALNSSEGDGEYGGASGKTASSPHTLTDERRQQERATSLSHLFADETSRNLDTELSNYLFETSDNVSMLENMSSPTISFDIDVSSTSIATASGTDAHSCLPLFENDDQPLHQSSGHASLDEEERTDVETALNDFATLPSSPLFAYPGQREGTSHAPPPQCSRSRMSGRKGERVLALEPELVAGGTGLESSVGGDVQTNTMQQLSELGRKLFAHATVAPSKRAPSHQYHSCALGENNVIVADPSPNENATRGVDDMNVELDSHNHSHGSDNASDNHLDQLTAHVIESSSTFFSILRRIPPRASFDMAATMLILTTYIRLAQLHHNLYTHIRSILPPSETRMPLAAACATSYRTPRSSEPSNSGNSTATAATFPRPSIPVPFPHLQIGGVSLAAYPRFQLKFILQICVHHLGEVELLLGLPAESCVGGGKRSRRHGEWSGEDSGVLHRNTGGMTLLVRTIMMEANETVKEIRRVLTDLTEELQASIQV
ncbi:hypothetical protein MMC28_010490 [Mycoblastus sanguinarius]|nr:hypothetical protein [Mycoblastus sanguinarius]